MKTLFGKKITQIPKFYYKYKFQAKTLFDFPAFT